LVVSLWYNSTQLSLTFVLLVVSLWYNSTQLSLTFVLLMKQPTKQMLNLTV
jgi:hypothetical protein